MVAGWAYEWKRGGMEWDETLPSASATDASELVMLSGAEASLRERL